MLMTTLAVRPVHRTRGRPLVRRVARHLGAVAMLLAVSSFAAPPSLAIPTAGQEEPAPRRYDVDEEFVQGIVRDVSEGGRVLLVELREDHELLRGTDPVVSDPSILRDPTASSLRTADRRDGRLRQLDLGAATGWAFIDDLEGGDPEVLPLDGMYERFREGQIVEIGASWDSDATATLVDSFGGRRAATPDPRDVRGATTAFQGRVDEVRIEGRIQVRINRAFE